MYFIKCETDRQSRLDAWDKCLRLVHWDDPEGWDVEGGGRGGSGWGTHVNPWLIHVNIWQKSLQYCKVISLQLIKINEKKRTYIYFSSKIWIFLFRLKFCKSPHWHFQVKCLCFLYYIQSIKPMGIYCITQWTQTKAQ